MTYLELVNEVLVLMRLDTITTTVGVEDEAVKVVISHINAAKRKVENSWRWNALRDTWALTMVPGTKTYTLDGTENQVIVEDVVNSRGYYLDQTSPKFMRRKEVLAANGDIPLEYAINGANAQREVQIDFWPTPQVADNITVSGWKTQAPLSSDDDTMLVPDLPVIYEALAMSLRERGEVGGQTALEAFGMAKRYLEDAIALDEGMNEMDTNWVMV